MSAMLCSLPVCSSNGAQSRRSGVGSGRSALGLMPRRTVRSGVPCGPSADAPRGWAAAAWPRTGRLWCRRRASCGAPLALGCAAVPSGHQTILTHVGIIAAGRPGAMQQECRDGLQGAYCCQWDVALRGHAGAVAGVFALLTMRRGCSSAGGSWAGCAVAAAAGERPAASIRPLPGYAGLLSPGLARRG